MGREGAGHRAAITRRENQMLRQVAELRTQYDSPGKREVRRLLLAVAKESGCRTALEFAGGLEFTEQLIAAGIDVTVAESDPKIKPMVLWAAPRLGFTPFTKRASRLPGQRDLVFADFCGPLTVGTSEPELHRLAPKAAKWLAVTVSPDRQPDELLQGGKRVGSAYADATMAARLVAVTDMSIQYLCRYQRNERGQWMWFALLQPAKSTAKHLDPASITRTLQHRTWWGSTRFRYRFADLLPLHYRVPTDHVRSYQHARWLDPIERVKRDAWRAANRSRINEQQRLKYAADPERYQKYGRDFHARHREERNAATRAYVLSPEQRARHNQKSREYRARKKLQTTGQ